MGNIARHIPVYMSTVLNYLRDFWWIVEQDNVDFLLKCDIWTTPTANFNFWMSKIYTALHGLCVCICF